MEFEALINKARAIRHAYAEYEQQQYGRSWTSEELALGFLGDVGDLMKLVQACEGVRHIPDANTKIAHELADCLWSILVLADEYGVDLEHAFTETMRAIEEHLLAATTARNFYGTRNT